MKTLIITLAVLGAQSSFAFNANLQAGESVSVEAVAKSGATVISCRNDGPRCILIGKQYGIQYPGQNIADVQLTETYSESSARNELAELKEEGFCK